MGTTAYSSGKSKRIFTNYPFKKGMVFQNLIGGEFLCKSVINYDYTNAGDYVFPRPAFVNAMLHNGVASVLLPEASIVMETNLGPKYLISTDTWVSTEHFANDIVEGVPEITGTFGLHINKLEQDVTNYETSRGVKEVIRLNALSNSRILVKDSPSGTPYSVKLIGVSNLEELTPYAEVAFMALHQYTSGKTLRLVFDPSSSEKTNGDVLAYLFANDMCVNYLMLYKGYAHLENINDTYMLYDELREAYYTAVNAGYRLHNHELAPTDLQAEGAYQVSVLANSEFVLANAVEHTKELYFKQGIVEQINIDSVFYDTFTFRQAELVATDLFTPEVGNTYIQMLRNEYKKDDYNNEIHYFEYPFANHTWRNALSFLGRVVVAGEVKYKGLITIQVNSEKLFRIILIKPEKVNPLLWNVEEISSTALNAYDKRTVFEDEVFTENAMYFRYPTMSSTLIYDKDPILQEGQILKRFARQQSCFIKPYVMIPEMPTTDFKRTQMRFKFSPKQDPEDGWVDLIVPSSEAIGINEGAKILNSTGTLAYLINTIYILNNSLHITVSNATAWNNQLNKADYTQSDMLITDLKKFPIGAIVRCGTNPYYYLKISLRTAVQDFNELNARSLEVEMRTLYVKTDSINVVKSNPAIIVNTSFLDNTKKIDLDLVVTLSYREPVQNATLQIDFSYYDRKDSSIKGEIKQTHDLTEYSPFFLFSFNGITMNFGAYSEGIVLDSDSSATITITNDYNEYETVMPSQLIYLTGTEVLNTDSLYEHDIYNATNLVQLDRYLILYGEHIGSNCLQFLEYDNFSLAPFPYGQIMFDKKIIHVHTHRGSLYIFCEDGVWLLHKGFGFSDMTKTFAYAGIKLHNVEKGTVSSLGNNVFVLNNNRCFVIRTNVNVEDSSDIYTVPISTAINQILEDPIVFLKDRFQYGYSQVVDDAKDLKSYFKVFVDNQEIYLTATYLIKDPIQKILVSFIYNNETGRWKIYDSLAATVPIELISSDNSKGFDYLCLNDLNNGVPTLATYLYEIPTNNLYDHSLGDAICLIKDYQGEWKPASIENGVNNPFTPIACEFDTGSLDLNSMHKKKVRRFYLNIINVDGDSLEFKAIPYIDGIPESDNISVEALLNIHGDLTDVIAINLESLTITPEHYVFISPTTELIEGYTIPESHFTTRSRLILDIRTNLLGKVPGLRMLIPTTSRYHITHYAMVYRQQMAR